MLSKGFFGKHGKIRSGWKIYEMSINGNQRSNPAHVHPCNKLRENPKNKRQFALYHKPSAREAREFHHLVQVTTTTTRKKGITWKLALTLNFLKKNSNGFSLFTIFSTATSF